MSATKVMVVEDDVLIAEDIRISLEDMGYCVCSTVTSGEEAIEQAAEQMPDVVLMDIVLGGEMDGVEAAETLGAEYDFPVVFLTSFADEETLERARTAGPFGYLVKPFEDRELRATLEMALYKHRAEQEREKLIRELEEANAKIKTLRGILPICGYCKKIRDDQGYWDEVEVYVRNHSEAEFSHSLCPECYEREIRALREKRPPGGHEVRRTTERGPNQ